VVNIGIIHEADDEDLDSVTSDKTGEGKLSARNSKEETGGDELPFI